MYLSKENFVLEGATHSQLFFCENCVSVWKEYFLQITIFKVPVVSVSSKYSYSAELKKHMNHSKENHLCYKQEHLADCFPGRIVSLFGKEYFLQLRWFEVEVGSHCTQYGGYYVELKKNMYCLNESHVCYNHEHVAYCSPVTFDLGFEMNWSFKLGFVQVEIGCVFAKLGHSTDLTKHMYLYREIHLC
jgi:hypothetical protein